MIRLNAAGRFWVGYALVLALALGWGSSAHAGYYASITNGGSVVSWKANGTVSGCYMTVGMAIGSLSTSQPITVTAISSESSTWTGAMLGTYIGSGSWGTCTSAAATGTQAGFSGGASDPAFVDGGIATGGSGGSSADLTALQNTVTELQGQLAAVSAANVSNSAELGRVNAVLNEPFDLQTALLATAFFYGTVLSFYAIAKSAGAILTMIKKPTPG